MKQGTQNGSTRVTGVVLRVDAMTQSPKLNQDGAHPVSVTWMN